MSRKTYNLTLTEKQLRHLEQAMFTHGNEDLELKDMNIHMRIWEKIVEVQK